MKSLVPFLVLLACGLSASPAAAQAVGGADKARPVAGDPGLSSMMVMDQPLFRVLRDYAEPGAVRRLHSHDDATWHVLVLVTGQLLLTVDDEAPVEVTQGQVLSLKGGVKHTFKNTGTVTATIVEVFGKGAPAAALLGSCAVGPVAGADDDADVGEEIPAHVTAADCAAKLGVVAQR
jgi:quercetin dioxygenase-like cupin family protein